MRVIEGLAVWFVGQHSARAEHRTEKRRARRRAQRLRKISVVATAVR